MKTNLTLTFIILVLVAFSYTMYSKARDNKKNYDRMYRNFDTLQNEINDIKSTSRVIQLSVLEVKRSFPELRSQIESDLQVKLKNVVQVSNTVNEVNSQFHTYMKDSIILDTIPIKTIAYKDAYLDFQADILDNQIFVNRNMVTDSIMQVVYKDRPPGFPFGRGWFKKKVLHQTISSSNPNARIKYSRVIQLSK